MTPIQYETTMKQVNLNVLGKENLFELIREQWMLITAGDKKSFNTMRDAGLPYPVLCGHTDKQYL